MRVSSSSAPPAVASLAVAARPSLRARWAEELATPASRRSWLLLVLVLFGGLVPVVPGFFHYIQQRPGLLLPDPLLDLLPRYDVANAIFFVMYGAVVVGVGWLICHPAFFLRGLWALFLLLLLRMLTIWAVPLLPPAAMLPLPDPLTAHLFHSSASEAITKDLFFSGHTATVALLALAVRGRWWRGVLWSAAVVVATLVLVQRVHYTYDVLAAPLFSWLAYWLGGLLVSKYLNAPTRAPRS